MCVHDQIKLHITWTVMTLLIKVLWKLWIIDKLLSKVGEANIFVENIDQEIYLLPITPLPISINFMQIDPNWLIAIESFVGYNWKINIILFKEFYL